MRASARSLHSFPLWPGGAGKHTTSEPDRTRGTERFRSERANSFGRSRMPNRPGNDDRITGGVGDRGAQRDVSGNNTRGNGSQQSGQGQARSRSNRGFASMDREKQREIASKGGRAAHAKGTAHEFDSGEARDAGRKGGVAVSRNRDHMAAIGRRGGEARGHARGGRAGVNTGAAATG